MTWGDRQAAASASCPALAAVYESADGRLALLLRHTLLPLPQERERWLEATGRAAADVVRALRAAGAKPPYVIAQWRPFEEIVEIADQWACRFVGDAERQRELVAVARRFLADEPATAVGGDGPPPGGTPAETALVAAARGAGSVADWYDGMAPCWLSAQPAVRRTLILRTHRFIAESLLLPLSQGAPVSAADLAPGGPLARALLAAVPAGQVDQWRPWIALVLCDLRRAMTWAPGRRSRAWMRWLFLIPYSIPAPRRLTRQAV